MQQMRRPDAKAIGYMPYPRIRSGYVRATDGRIFYVERAADGPSQVHVVFEDGTVSREVFLTHGFESYTMLDILPPAELGIGSLTWS
jgi:hypothetical protein